MRKQLYYNTSVNRDAAKCLKNTETWVYGPPWVYRLHVEGDDCRCQILLPVYFSMIIVRNKTLLKVSAGCAIVLCSGYQDCFQSAVLSCWGPFLMFACRRAARASSTSRPTSLCSCLTPFSGWASRQTLWMFSRWLTRAIRARSTPASTTSGLRSSPTRRWSSFPTRRTSPLVGSISSLSPQGGRCVHLYTLLQS